MLLGWEIEVLVSVVDGYCHVEVDWVMDITMFHTGYQTVGDVAFAEENNAY